MLLVAQESAYQLVVILMILLAEPAALGFEKNDGRTGVVGFVKCAALDDRILRRRRIPGHQRLRIGLGGLFDGGHEHGHQDSDCQPEQEDR